MAKCNFLFFLNAYSDLCQTSAPALNQFKWSREINGVPYALENSQQIQVLPVTTSSNILPVSFATPVLTTATSTNGTTALTITGSNTGIAANQLIVGTGIPVGTFVNSVTGSAVVMSQAATTTATPTVSFYNPASFIYMESDLAVSVIYNNGSPMAIEPFEINGSTIPGVFFMNGPCYSITVTNPGTTVANIFFASMG
jgi:hypothetical protein